MHQVHRVHPVARCESSALIVLTRSRSDSATRFVAPSTPHWTPAWRGISRKHSRSPRRASSLIWFAVLAGARTALILWLLYKRARRQCFAGRSSFSSLALLQIVLGLVMAYGSLLPAAQVGHLTTASLILGRKPCCCSRHGGREYESRRFVVMVMISGLLRLFAPTGTGANPTNQSAHYGHAAPAAARTALLGNLGSYHRTIKTTNDEGSGFSMKD